jgi:nucleoside permease NupC
MRDRIINLLAFSVLTLLWLAFAAALLFNRELLDITWQAFRGWPLIIQVVVGLLVLPVTAGLWIWQTSWPLILRLVLVAGLAWVTVYTFFPRKSGSATQASPVKP